jgi:hypothetical protein
MKTQITIQCRFYHGQARYPYIHRNDVVQDEVRAVMSHPGEDFPAIEGARMVLGQIKPGERYLRIIYVPDLVLRSIFVLTAFTLRGEVLRACRARQRREGRHWKLKTDEDCSVAVPGLDDCRMPLTDQFPPGWDEERIQRVLAHYEMLDPEMQCAEDEAAAARCGNENRV